MALDLLPNQPPEPPTTAQIFARVEDLPLDLGAFARAVLAAPGITAAELLTEADRCDAVAASLRADARHLMAAEAATWSALATILRDAAPRFPSPPRIPLTAEEAERSIRMRSYAAGVITASSEPGP